MRRFQDAAAGTTLVRHDRAHDPPHRRRPVRFSRTRAKGRSDPVPVRRTELSRSADANLTWDKAGWLVRRRSASPSACARCSTGAAPASPCGPWSTTPPSPRSTARRPSASPATAGCSARCWPRRRRPRTRRAEPLDLKLTFFVLNAYGAAVFGRLKSLPLTFVGAIVLGLMQNYARLDFPPQLPGQRRPRPGDARTARHLPVPRAAACCRKRSSPSAGSSAASRPASRASADSVVRAVVFVPSSPCSRTAARRRTCPT